MVAGSITKVSKEMLHPNDSASSCKQLEAFCKAVVSLASTNKKVNAVNYSVPQGRFEGRSLSLKRKAGNEEALDLDTTRVSTSCTEGGRVGTVTATAVTIEQRSNNGGDSNVASPAQVKKIGATSLNAAAVIPLTTIGTRSRSKNAVRADNPGSVSPPEGNDDEESPSISSRPLRRQRSAASREKQFVKYNMSKTPHFQRNVAFLRSVALEQGTCQHQEHSRSSSVPAHLDGIMENSLIWTPQGREEWFDCTDELAALCAEASLRWALNPKSLALLTTLMSSTQRQQGHTASLAPESARTLELPTPLSKAYIRERLDIDDPLRGYQIRHAQGGWLQGFMIWTTFTTWTRYFQWNSLHNASGMLEEDVTHGGRLYDITGEFANELEAQPRSGDPLKGGVVWPSIAEIGLVGGLGCGEYLLHMALEDMASQGCYEYVVLQATETSWSFYEKFGFVRIGAVCTYGQSDDVCGYRHWTYADEKNLDTRHGGPSYMMAKKIQPRPSDGTERLMDALPATGIWEALHSKVVAEKPTILAYTKQDDYLLDHPNPYASAIVDVMKKGDTWWKQLNSETYNQLMLPQHGHKPRSVTSNASSGVKRRIKIVTSRKSVANVPPVVTSTVTPLAPDIISKSATSKSVSLKTGGIREGEERNCKRIKLGHTSMTKSTLEAATTVTHAKACTDQNEENLSAPSRQTEEQTTRRKQHASVQASAVITGPQSMDFSLEKPVCRMEKQRILKQKFTDKPNAKDANPFFFNKVVTPKRSSDSGALGPFCFVVYYDKKKNQLTVIELEAHGHFLGKLKHRTRWRAVGKDAKDKRLLLKVVNGSDYEIVPAEMVTKSSCVHEEGWNLLVD